jgi:hypothetical protein
VDPTGCSADRGGWLEGSERTVALLDELRLVAQA